MPSLLSISCSTKYAPFSRSAFSTSDLTSQPNLPVHLKFGVAFKLLVHNNHPTPPFSVLIKQSHFIDYSVLETHQTLNKFDSDPSCEVLLKSIHSQLYIGL